MTGFLIFCGFALLMRSLIVKLRNEVNDWELSSSGLEFIYRLQGILAGVALMLLVANATFRDQLANAFQAGANDIPLEAPISWHSLKSSTMDLLASFPGWHALGESAYWVLGISGLLLLAKIPGFVSLCRQEWEADTRPTPVLIMISVITWTLCRLPLLILIAYLLPELSHFAGWAYGIAVWLHGVGYLPLKVGGAILMLVIVLGATGSVMPVHYKTTRRVRFLDNYDTYTEVRKHYRWED
ncbi:hypothetical protein AYJ57_21480 (plasmid) [Salipiger sp. CCB-MM3]|uniref:hypothetical protein n=1 Tax=Salipiger sp. CCB-MM3 TaxID=1792508 RepID=UPI00080ABE54|nr:hypothetical protein [Salipiger sp. CCB-MM3]ANT63048.1 hypothetical protein AYJ57_21480 [Salipiger sp. CCB-MM3]